MFHDLVQSGAVDRWRLAGLYALFGGAALVLWAVDPLDKPFFPKCPLRLLTGLHCPGCGSARALHHALHGNFGAAFCLNPLLFFLIPLAVYPVASDVNVLIRGRALPRLTLFRGWWIGLATVIAAFGILRNIPVYPFSLLAP